MCENRISFVFLMITLLSASAMCDTRLSKVLMNYEKPINQSTEKLVNLLHTCFFDNLDMIVIAGNDSRYNWTDISSLPLYQLSLSKTNVFQRHMRLQGVYTVDINFASVLRYPAKMYIVHIPSSDYQILLKRLRKSILWNARAYFILINEDWSKGCLNLRHVFFQLWDSFNVLNALYICENEIGSLNVYTFNPFEHSPSRFWIKYEEEKVYESKNYTMKYLKFTHDLHDINSSVCEAITIKKAQALDGYPINVTAQLLPTVIDYKNDTLQGSKSLPLNCFTGFEASLSQILWSKLNTEPTLTIHEFGGYVSRKNKVYGILALIINNTYDMALNERYMRPFWRLQTYPHDTTGLCALTRKITVNLELSVSQIIANPTVLISIIFTCCVNAIILMYILKIDLILASSNILQALLGMSITKQPNEPIKRFIFICIVIFYFIMNIYFESQLTSTFTTSLGDENINTLQDLIDSNYSLLGDISATEFLPNNLLGRFNESTVEDCLKLTPTENIACLCDCGHTDNYDLQNFSIHISKNLYDTPLVFMVHEDWPLLNRVNFIIQTLRESGIISYEFYAASHQNEYRMKVKETERDEKDDALKKSLPLKDFIYNLRMLAIGLSIAFGAFLGENVGKIRKKKDYNKKLDHLKIFQVT